LVAVRWYLRYSLSYRDVEELLAERGVQVDGTVKLTMIMIYFAKATTKCRLVQRIWLPHLAVALAK
jgi:transposase, IS6 family